MSVLAELLLQMLLKMTTLNRSVQKAQKHDNRKILK